MFSAQNHIKLCDKNYKQVAVSKIKFCYLQQKKVLLLSASSSPNLLQINNANALLTPFHSFINNLFNCSHVEGWIEPGISLCTSATILHLDVKRTNIKGTQQEHKLLYIYIYI
jgi:hypothetical protein